MRLTILHTNDLHAEYESWLRCVAFIKKRRAELKGAPCLLLDAGDHFDMSVDECGLSRGELHRALLDELRLDAFVPGNNEFYRASLGTLSRLSSESSFPWVLSTVETAEGASPAGFKRSLLLERGVGVGILGALAPMDGAAEELHGLVTLDAVPALVAQARELRARGAQIILLLSHCGLDEDLRLAEATGDNIDVIVGGHSHSVLNEPRLVGRTIVVQAGGLGTFVGELEIEIGAAGILAHRYWLHPIDEHADQDPAQRAILEVYRESAQQQLGEAVFELAEEVSRSRLLRLAAELLRSRFDADFGMIFEPAVTAGLTAGLLRVRDLYSVSRSFITPASFEISGRQIEGLIREGFDPRIIDARGFGIGFRPQGLSFGRLTFSGLEWEGDASGITAVRIAGGPLDPDRWYRVGSLTHLFSPETGGYPSLAGSRNLKALRFHLLRDALVDFFRSGEATRYLHGRTISSSP